MANYLSLCLHKGRPATGEAFSPQKRTSSTSKHKTYLLFQFLDPEPDALTNPDPKHCLPQRGSGTKVGAKGIFFLKSVLTLAKLMLSES
jgi:hypothetical protein